MHIEQLIAPLHTCDGPDWSGNRGAIIIFIWGKRTYGNVQKVGNVSVKTMFGHLWYLPLFPMSSYYFVEGSKNAFELKAINWRSVLCGYVRVWVPLVFVMSLLGFQNAHDGNQVLPAVMMLLTAGAIAASYLLDKKFTDQQAAEVRNLMERHFGVAVDPYQCAGNLQMEINERMQAVSAAQIDEHWYKRTLNDAFCSRDHTDLALLRARCDQHDASLQEIALRKLQRSGSPA